MPRRRSQLLSPTYWIRRQGLYKGILGGSRGWRVVGITFFATRYLRKTFGRSEEVVSVETLKPGQFASVQAIKPPTRRARRAAARG
jgi:hypothetical protein